MTRRWPPLSSLRSFEAVARQLSFSKAVEELHVTPGAINQQIRSLEDSSRPLALFPHSPPQHPIPASEEAWLFDGTRRSVALTNTAVRILPDIQPGLEILARAMAGKAAPIVERTLPISVAPTFT